MAAKPKLSKRQTSFAKGIAAGLPPQAAALAAGYVNKTPNGLRVQASRLNSNPDVQRLAYEERESRLAGPLAVKALNTLEAILDDSGTPSAARIQAARYILDAAGHGIDNKRLRLRSGEDADTPTRELSLAALELLAIAAEERVMIERAAVIDV